MESASASVKSRSYKDAVCCIILMVSVRDWLKAWKDNSRANGIMIFFINRSSLQSKRKTITYLIK